MEYMHRGNAKSDPRSVVVIPHRAPIDTRYLAHVSPKDAKASGKAAVGLISLYGTIRVRAPLTKIYPRFKTNIILLME